MSTDFRDLLKLDAMLFEKDGVFYFTPVSGDIRPSGDSDASDKNKWSYWRKNNFDFFKSELERIPQDKILVDLGAGQSDFSELTSQFNHCAVDFYPYKGISVVCDFGKGLPFKDNSADIILMSNLLEHISEPNLLLAECHRILKREGIILGTVPFMIDIHQRPHDFYRYTDINLNYLLEKHDFKKISVSPVLSAYEFLIFALTNFFHHAIGRKNFILRLVWWKVRLLLKIFGSVLKRYKSDPDTPLGYLIKAEKI